jgi:hypothetical protein
VAVDIKPPLQQKLVQIQCLILLHHTAEVVEAMATLPVIPVVLVAVQE